MKKQPIMVDFDNDSVLDIGATFSSMKNKSLLAGVCEVEKPMIMCTNTGERAIAERGTMLGMKDESWLDKESMANTIGSGEMKKQHRVTCNSDVKDVFDCHAHA